MYRCFHTAFFFSSCRSLCWPLLNYTRVAVSPICYSASAWIATGGQVSPVTSSILKIQRSRERTLTQYGSNQRTPLYDKGKPQTQKTLKWFAISSKESRRISTIKLEYFNYENGKQEEANGHLIRV